MNEEILIKINEKDQKELFTEFIKKFDKDFSKGSNYLNISKVKLSKYKTGRVKYISEDTLTKVVNYLKMEKPEIIKKVL